MHQRAIRAGGLLAGLLLLAACQLDTPTDKAANASPLGSDTSAAGAPAPSQESEAAVKPTGIDAIVALRSIGATKEFLERTLGQSTYETPESAHYTAGGCDVTVNFGSDKAVRQVAIALKPGCGFSAKALAGEELTVDGPMTFAEFEQTFGQAHYTASCLTSCGNAYDPLMDAVVNGTRASDGIGVAAHAAFVDEKVINASDVWEDGLRAKAGEDFVINTSFNCDRSHDEIARAAFEYINVESLHFGRDLGSTDCG